jgi:hypothetical protein
MRNDLNVAQLCRTTGSLQADKQRRLLRRQLAAPVERTAGEFAWLLKQDLK